MASCVRPLLLDISIHCHFQIGGINFTVDDQEKYLATARNDAFAKARTKAELMASQNGARLGRLVNTSESQGPIPYPYYAMDSFGKGAVTAAPSAPTIEPGSQEVTVTVSLTYALN